MASQPHYGGILNPSGIGRRMRSGGIFRTEIILEKLVRFDLAKASGQSLLSDADIARVLGKSVRAIVNYRAKLSYLKKRMEITTGISTDSENFVKDTSAKHKQMLRLLMPDALRAVADAIQFKPSTLAEKKFRFDVAKEILDREGTFPKISRTDIHQKVEHDFSSIDGVSAELLASIEGGAQDEETASSLIEVLNANKKFSNSSTLSAMEQEAALATLEAMPVPLGIVN